MPTSKVIFLALIAAASMFGQAASHYAPGPISTFAGAPTNPCHTVGERWINTATQQESLCGTDGAWHVTAGASAPATAGMTKSTGSALTTATPGVDYSSALWVNAADSARGGIVCDGATDNTAGFATLVNYLNTTYSALVGGVIVQFPSGVCKTSAIPVINVSVKLQGAGKFAYQTSSSPLTQFVPPTVIDLTSQTSGDGLVLAGHGSVLSDIAILFPLTYGGPIAPPTIPVLSQVAGSCATPQTYFSVATYTYVDSLGIVRETSVSPEQSLAVTGTNCLQVASPTAKAGATGWRVYISTNSNFESMQSATPTAIGTAYTMPTGTALNTGIQPGFNTTLSCAVETNEVVTMERSRIYSPAVTPAVAPGCGFFGNSYTTINDSMINAFHVGVMATAYGPANNGAPDNIRITNSYIRANDIGIVSDQYNDLKISGNEFFLSNTAAIQLLWGGAAHIYDNYDEDNYSGATFVQLGTTTPVQSSLPPLMNRSTEIGSNYINCKGFTTPAIQINQNVQGLDIHNNQASACGSVTAFIHNANTLTLAGIRIYGLSSNNNALTPTQWLDSMTGVSEGDIDLISATSTGPGDPWVHNAGGYFAHPVGFGSQTSPAHAIDLVTSTDADPVLINISTASGHGIHAVTTGSNGVAVFGQQSGTSTGGAAVEGVSTTTGATGIGVQAISQGASSIGVGLYASVSNATTGKFPILATGGLSGFGSCDTTGALCKSFISDTGQVASVPVLTSALPACPVGATKPWRGSVSDAVTPAVGSNLTGGGSVFANVHCSPTTGLYVVDGI